MQQFCETSSIFEGDNIQNETIPRDFLQNGKLSAELTASYQCVFAIFPIYVSTVLRLPRQIDARSYEVLHLSRKIIVPKLKIWRSKMQRAESLAPATQNHIWTFKSGFCSSLLWLFSPLLFHLSILSEVWLLLFLRSRHNNIINVFDLEPPKMGYEGTESTHWDTTSEWPPGDCFRCIIALSEQNFGGITSRSVENDGENGRKTQWVGQKCSSETLRGVAYGLHRTHTYQRGLCSQPKSDLALLGMV